MPTATAPHAPATPLDLARPPTPPRAATLQLRDGGTVVGWVEGGAFGFGGFHDETEAAHAAWVAFRTMSRRFARRLGRRPPPVDREPMSLARSGDVELILAGGKPIATLVRPGAGRPTGPDAFGFELQLPVPADAITARSTAYLVYRTLRRSGIRWAMWAPRRDAARAPEGRVAPSGSAADATPPARPAPAPPPPRDGDHGAAAVRRDAGSGALAATVLILVLLAAVVLPALTLPTMVGLLGVAAAGIAVVALASLVHLVAADLRAAVRARPRDEPPTGRARRLPRAPSWPARLRELARAR